MVKGCCSTGSEKEALMRKSPCDPNILWPSIVLLVAKVESASSLDISPWNQVCSRILLILPNTVYSSGLSFFSSSLTELRARGNLVRVLCLPDFAREILLRLLRAEIDSSLWGLSSVAEVRSVDSFLEEDVLPITERVRARFTRPLWSFFFVFVFFLGG